MATEDFSGAVSIGSRDPGAFHLYVLSCSTRCLLTSALSSHGEEMAVVVPDVTPCPHHVFVQRSGERSSLTQAHL